METIKLPQRIFIRIMETLGTVPPEAGGIFMLSQDTVSSYFFDEAAGAGKKYYKPSGKVDLAVNHCLESGHQCFGGFIHSHRPGASAALSPMDVLCAESNLKSNDLPWIFMSVVYEERLYLYKLTAGAGDPYERLETCTFEILNDDCFYQRKIPGWFETLIKDNIAQMEGV